MNTLKRDLSEMLFINKRKWISNKIYILFIFLLGFGMLFTKKIKGVNISAINNIESADKIEKTDELMSAAIVKKPTEQYNNAEIIPNISSEEIISESPADKNFNISPITAQTNNLEKKEEGEIAYFARISDNPEQNKENDAIIGELASKPNNLPIIFPIEDKIVNWGESISFDILANDADTQDELTYKIKNLPAGAIFTSQTFSWTPTMEQAGNYALIFSVSDKKQETEKIVNIYVCVVDNQSPADISDLMIKNCSISSCEVSWSAPGDNQSKGTAESYIIKYSKEEINESNWNNAVTVKNPPLPQISGSIENFIIDGLLPKTTYYFAIKSSDDAKNESGLSNTVYAATTAKIFYMPDSCPNLEDCLLILTDGDTLIIRDGTYTGEKNKVIPWAKNRTAKDDIIIKAEHPDNVIIGEGGTTVNLKFIGGKSSSYYQIEGIIWKIGK